MPDSLDDLDLLLMTVAKARAVQRDGIHFQGLRYVDTTLAAYVGESVTIRFDPRDVSEIRVFHRNRFLCRAVSPEYADRTVTLNWEARSMTAVHLRRIDSAKNMRRFYRLDVQPDLFGGVLLMKEWGRIGAQGRIMAGRYDSEAPALAALQRQAERKRRRGYGDL
jgi:predicted DNA-binding WGR domain protein